MNTEMHALWSSAHAHALAGRYSEAIPDYQAALQLDPKNANTHFDRHLAYREMGQLQLAFQELGEAASLFPDDSNLIHTSKSKLYDFLGGSNNASVLQEIISQLPENAASRQTLLGLQASQRGNHIQARTHFENALREQPDVPYIQSYLGRTLLFLRRNAEAHEILASATRDERAKPQDLYNLAMAERRLRNSAAAVLALERAVQIDKNYYKAWTMLATAKFLSGHGRSALRYFRQAVRCSPQMQEQSSKTAA